MTKGRKAAKKKKTTREHHSLHRRTMVDSKVAEMVVDLRGLWAGIPIAHRTCLSRGWMNRARALSADGQSVCRVQSHRLAVANGDGLRSLFNQPEVTALLRADDERVP
jgi:hypothetical protein